MNRFSTFTRRLIALFLLVVVLALPYVLVVQPIMAEFESNQQQIERYQELILRYRTIAADRPALEQELELAQRNIFPSQYYFSGDNPALVTASLQNQIKTFVEGSGGRLLSTQILPPEPDNGSTRVSVRVRMTGSVDSLYKTLYAIESNRPALFVESVDLNARQTRGRRRQREGETEAELMATFDVYGYLQPA